MYVISCYVHYKNECENRFVTLEDAACEQGMWVTAPAIKDVMVIPHHDLGDAGQGICQVPAAPVLTVVREVEVCRLFGHCICPVVRAETL